MNTNDIWKNDFPTEFARTLTSITDQQVMQSFLRDVMTEKEIVEISARLRAAKMLVEGRTYVTITEETKLSSTTVARISDWLQNGSGGYAAIITNKNHSHM